MLRDIGEWFYHLRNPEPPLSPLPESAIIYTVHDPVAPQSQDYERVRAILMYGMRGSNEFLDYDHKDEDGWPTEIVPGVLEAIFVERFGPSGSEYRTGISVPKTPNPDPTRTSNV